MSPDVIPIKIGDNTGMKHSPDFRKRRTFLLQFQERHTEVERPTSGTETMTRTSEAPDQSPRALAPILAGTRTATATHGENVDQDHSMIASTQTLTETNETPDQTAGHRSYFAIPRACSLS